MRIDGKHYRSIWTEGSIADFAIKIIDQRILPHEFLVASLSTTEEVIVAIKEMWVRGAPLIGVSAAFGFCLAIRESMSAREPQKELDLKYRALLDSRPTAVNLEWALKKQYATATAIDDWQARLEACFEQALSMAEEDARVCESIGLHGLSLIEAISEKKKGEVVHILTHCNAGWLACVDWGTATAPIYKAFEKGIQVHVWVDETRPRNQGSKLTAWELGKHGIPHTVIVDNAGGHLMQHGMVDICLVGTDRTTLQGDVANKIGTYLKALAAKDNDIPFYVALPGSTIDWEIKDAFKEIPIESRSADEVKRIEGLGNNGLTEVLLTPPDSPASNFAFDVTPARLVSGLITERGICKAEEEGIRALFPEKLKRQ